MSASSDNYELLKKAADESSSYIEKFSKPYKPKSDYAANIDPEMSHDEYDLAVQATIDEQSPSMPLQSRLSDLIHNKPGFDYNPHTTQPRTHHQMGDDQVEMGSIDVIGNVYSYSESTPLKDRKKAMKTKYDTLDIQVNPF